MHRITLIAALAIVSFAGLTGAASAQSASVCSNTFIEVNGQVLVDNETCLPPASSRRSAAAPSLCGSLYANVNGNEVVNQEVCLPPASRKASRRAAGPSLCVDVYVNVNGEEQAQAVCLPPAASRKARSRSRRSAGGCVYLYLEVNGTVVADETHCTPAKRR